MSIFHSYVKWPEGKCQFFLVKSHFDHLRMPWKLVEDIGQYPTFDAKEQAFSQHLSHLMAKQLGFLNFFWRKTCQNAGFSPLFHE